jgi:type VI protein secretion system component VasF
MDPDVETETLQYVIPSRTISGSAQEILEELDDMMEALQLVREAVVARTPKPARQPRRGWLERVRRALALDDHPAASAKRYPTHGSVSR